MITIKDEELDSFLQEVLKVYGHDFRQYLRSTLRRRIHLHSIFIKANSFHTYSQKVLSSKETFAGMFKYLSINVTEFFRGPSELKFLRQKVLPYLSSYSHIKIWEAGCSSAMTTYSLAIILEEMGLLKKSQIYATDFNNRVLDQAKEGFYDIKHLNVARKNYTLSGGEDSFDTYIEKTKGGFKMKESIKEKTLFFNHNLVLDKSMNEFQLILCKNVLIYFNEQLKNSVIELFDNSLCVNGFLAVGKNEYLSTKSLKNYREYEHNKRVFQKCK